MSAPASPAEGVADSFSMSHRRKLLLFGVMAFGVFMTLLDIQIVAASLSEMQAGLSAGPDEVSWIQTAYLMAELVMIPFSAFLAQAMSSRWLFAASAGLFTLSSIACGFAWNIESMMVFRAIQGFTGGAMIPTSFSVGFVLFTGEKRAIVPAVLGMATVLAPTLGPTVGGIITDYINWRWIFFINVVPGIAVTVLITALLRVDRPNPGLFRDIDWVHLIAMAVCLGCLEYVLEEGPRLDWLGDSRIAICAWLSLVAFFLFMERSFFSATPIVWLAPFRRPSFTFACLFNLVLGFGLFSSTYLIPVYLSRVRGFNSLQIGTTVFVVGISQLFGTLLAARLSQRVDVRLILAAGLPLFALSLWLTSHANAQWGFAELLVPQLTRGLAVMLCIVPSVGIALTGLEGRELSHASAIFSLMRNLGGAIGIAVVNTWLQDNTRRVMARFGEALGTIPHAFGEVVDSIVHRLTIVDPSQAVLAAQGLMVRAANQEAFAVAFDEVFRMMFWMFVVALLMVPFARQERLSAATPSDGSH